MRQRVGGGRKGGRWCSGYRVWVTWALGFFEVDVNSLVWFGMFWYVLIGRYEKCVDCACAERVVKMVCRGRYFGIVGAESCQNGACVGRRSVVGDAETWSMLGFCCSLL